MAEQEVLSKPQTIRVGVQGFSAFEAKPDTAAPAIGWLQSHQSDDPAQSPELYAEYCQGHAAKGYWPNETPLGEIKDQKK